MGDEAVKAEHWKDGFEMLIADGFGPFGLESAQDLKAAIKEEEKACTTHLQKPSRFENFNRITLAMKTTCHMFFTVLQF